MSLEVRAEPEFEEHSKKGVSVEKHVGKTWFQIPANTFTSDVTLD